MQVEKDTQTALRQAVDPAFVFSEFLVVEQLLEPRRVAAPEADAVDAVVCGAAALEPIHTAQRLHMRDKDLPIFILTPPDAMPQRQQALQVTPFLGRAVRLWPTTELDALPAALQAAVRHFHQRRRFHHTLASAQARLRHTAPLPAFHTRYMEYLLDYAPLGVLIVDAHGSILTLNRQASRILQVQEQQALGASLQHFFAPAVQAQVSSLLSGCLDADEPYLPTVLPLQCASAHARFVEVTATAFTTATSQAGIMLIVQDVTERVKTEQVRQQLEEQLRQSQKMEAIGTLAGGIAHEFNNVLSAILGFTELAQTQVEPNSTVWNYQQEVLTAGWRARDLVQQILAFSRRTTAGREPVQLHLVVHEVLRLLRASLPSTIDIRCAVAEDTGSVLADTTQMHQILMNLCANAEYAMRTTGGILEVRLRASAVDATGRAPHPTLPPGRYVHLAVHDTGTGMSPDVLERVFEPFFTTKGVGEGTGMGLAIVHGIVTSHGGAITVQSTPGVGTTFDIYLPCLDSPVAPLEAPKPPLPRGQGRILFVDDDGALAHLGHAMLEQLGYDVVTTTDSREALALFRATPQRFDLVLADQTMPHMTGEALVLALQRIRPDIPILLYTGFSHTIDATKAQALGVKGLLMKPLGLQELARAVQQALQPPAASAS
jgi:PAS domain S-box-containing protein